MEAAAPPLEDLRTEVDRIDQAILELLIERTDVVRRIGAVKADRAERSARRAAGARGGDPAPVWWRLAGERFPRPVLVRMWRELLAATTRLQTPMSVVGVHHPGSTAFAPGISRATTSARSRRWSGSTARARRCARSATAAPRVAVLPLPDDDDPWWLALMSDHQDRLRVFARLPFVAERRRRRRGDQRSGARPARAGAERRRSGAAGDRGGVRRLARPPARSVARRPGWSRSGSPPGARPIRPRRSIWWRSAASSARATSASPRC